MVVYRLCYLKDATINNINIRLLGVTSVHVSNKCRVLEVVILNFKN